MVNSNHPKSLEEALKLKRNHPTATLYAGGTDLMVSKKPFSHLIFIGQLHELKKIEEDDTYVNIGATATYRELLENPLIPEILKKAIREIAAPPIRNAGTIGGNICNASPAGDTLPILYLLDASVILASMENDQVVRREVLVADFITGIRQIGLRPDELVEKVRLPKAKFASTTLFGFQKVGARKAQAISKLVFSSALEVRDGKVVDFRVAYGAVGVTIVRNKEIESKVVGLTLSQMKGRIPEIIEAYDYILKPIDDQRSTASYRKKVCLNLLEDFLKSNYSRVLIKNGIVIDGTGVVSYPADVLIEDDRIEAIGPWGSFEGSCGISDDVSDDVKEYQDALVIDAKGLIVSPGFIDTHSHSDLKVLLEPELLPKIQQGITTEVLGQDGISMAPLPTEYISAWRKNLAGLDGDSSQIDWHYENTKNYLAMIEAARPALNECYLLPHGNVRMEAMGLEDREPTHEEIKEMCRITRREMEAGCLGLSSGLIYMPCAYANTQEIIEICKVVAEYDGVFVVHQRSEADSILTSMKEIIDIGRQSGVKIHFSHFKVCGKKNWKYLDEMFELMTNAQKEGIVVSLDQYPYVAGSTMLGVILPPWAHDGGTDQLVKRLADPSARTQMVKDIETGIPGWDNFVEFAGLEGIFITSVQTEKNKEVIGLNLLELGTLRGKVPLEATFDLLLEEENAVGMVDFYGLEEHVVKIMQRPEMNVCTDGLLSGTPHPRVYGAFPRVLGKYVREEKVMSIEAAVAKMTGKAASALGIRERGVLQVGYYADLAIWDLETIIDKGTFDQPKQRPMGIHHVLVNGNPVILNGEYTGNRSGKVIRRR